MLKPLSDAKPLYFGTDAVRFGVEILTMVPGRGLEIEVDVV
jgi:hypothetical protein